MSTFDLFFYLFFLIALIALLLEKAIKKHFDSLETEIFILQREIRDSKNQLNSRIKSITQFLDMPEPAAEDEDFCDTENHNPVTTS